MRGGVGGGGELVAFGLAAAAHHPVGAAGLVAGERAGDHFQLRMPGLAGVNQQAARFERIADAAQRFEHQIVVGKQFMQAGNDGQRGARLKVLVVGALKGIDFVESGDFAKTALGDQAAAGGDVERAVVAQAHGIGSVDTGKGIKHIAAVAGSDVEHMHRPPFGAQLFAGSLNGMGDVDFALADAAPADGIQILAVGPAAEGVAALRLVAVNIIERAAGIKTGFLPEFQPRAPAGAEFEQGAVAAPKQAPRAECRQRRCQLVGFAAALAVQMGIQQLRSLGRGGETLADKAAHLIKHGFAAAFAEGVVIKTGQHMALFDAAAQPVVKRVLRRVVHHPVAAGYEQLHRRANCLRVGHHALGGIVQTEQNAHGNGAGNQRVAVVALLALAVVAQIVRFDIAVDEKIAAPFVEQAQAAAGKGNVEFDFESGRREHGAADIRCVVVQPGRHQHRAHALGDNTNVLRRNAVGAADVADKGIDVGHRCADARAVAARARTHAVAACVPSEAGKIVQAQLVGHKHHAAGMLVAAVKQN